MNADALMLWSTDKELTSGELFSVYPMLPAEPWVHE
jgi:hypothetical protein